MISFIPLPGFFSKFPHGTFHYRLVILYLSLEGGPSHFKQNSACSVLLIKIFPFPQIHYLYGLLFSVYYIEYFRGFFCFRSPLLTKSLLFSFPLGTEMFHFPRFAPTKKYVGTLYRVGFPIRTPPDQRLQATSPKHFAG